MQHSSGGLAGRLTEVALGCQRALKRDPHQPQALITMCLVALASRQTEAALKMAAAATAAAPGMCAAWVALGQSLRSADRADEAARAYERAVQLDANDALARMGLGELKMADGHPQEAMAEFERALKRRPGWTAAHLGLGNALALMGQNEQALERYEAALALQPKLPEGHFAAGFVLARMGRVEDAEIRYRRALAMRPDFAAAWINLGSLLRDQGKDMYAEAALRRAVELRPDLISGWVNLGILERERGEPARAEQCLCRAFELNPRQAETLVAWCHFRVAENDVPGAWGWMRWALAANPEFDEAVNMHGILLHKAGRFEEAMEVFERAERLGSVSAASNRGNSLLDLGRVADSLHAYEAAVQRDPGNPGARYNLALTQLRMGDWERGWENYEARWKFREVHRTPRQMKQPRWRGEPLRGERILLHAEQGLGDTIQFCRYAELVVARGGVPILQVQPAAERLMRSLEVVRTGRAETATLGEKTPDAQWECPLMSLPAVFRTTVSTVPWSGPYLDVAQEMAEQKLVQFAGAAKGNPGSRRIGIAWAGNPRYKADHARSVRLKTLFPFLRSVDATWISLQKGDAAAQLADLPGDVCVLDGSTADADLAETAALMAGLDLVITTDTCVAHLAGAMGKPVWILVPWLADWRWMDGLETTPWYPSARLLRQATPGRWDELVHKAAEELTKSIYFSSVIYG